MSTDSTASPDPSAGTASSTSSTSSASQAGSTGSVRTQLLDAGMAALDTTPARLLSVRDLARDVGVSHAAPYRHFGDLTGFLVALATRCLRSLVDAQQSRIEDVTDPRTRLMLSGLEYVNWAQAHPHAFVLAFDPDINDPDSPAAELATVIDEHSELLGSLVTAAAPASADQQSVGVALWSAVHGLADLVAAGRVPRSAAGPAVDVMLAMLGHN